SCTKRVIKQRETGEELHQTCHQTETRLVQLLTCLCLMARFVQLLTCLSLMTRLVVQLLTCLCLMTRLGQLTPVNLCSGEVFVKCCFNDGDFQLKLHEMGQSPSTYAHTRKHTHTHTHTHNPTNTHTHTHNTHIY